jgi:hypothetical protein
MSLSLSPCSYTDPLAELRRMLLNSLVSVHTRCAYIAAFNQFFSVVAETGRPVCRALLMNCRAQMIDLGLSASAINVRLSASRKPISEARENNLLDPVDAARILTIPGVPRRECGLETGSLLGKPNASWLSPDLPFLLASPESTLMGPGYRRGDLAHCRVKVAHGAAGSSDSEAFSVLTFWLAR